MSLGERVVTDMSSMININNQIYRFLRECDAFEETFYSELDMDSEFEEIIYEKNINSEPMNQIPTFFVNTFKEMFHLSKKKIDCVICYETMTEHTLSLLPCFHMICTNCQQQLHKKKCPSCRKPF